jgi:hypothetical protein
LLIYYQKLYGILDSRAIEANLRLAKRAQDSAERMEDITGEMNRVALKTRDETVSMKIITLVTLFYLPGTFMSVCISYLLYILHPFIIINEYLL